MHGGIAPATVILPAERDAATLDGHQLASELRPQFQVGLIGPKLGGMDGSSGTGAKLERAVASGMLSKLEAGEVFLPRFTNGWLPKNEGELLSWTVNWSTDSI